MTISAVIFMSKEQFIHLLTLKNHFKVQIVIISELTKYLTKFGCKSNVFLLDVTYREICYDSQLI